MTITTRTGKGSALTHPEMDANLNTFNNWTSGPATKTAAKALTPEDGVKIYPQGSDGGVFIGGTGKAVGYYDDDSVLAYGNRFKPTGGDGSSGWERAEKGPAIDENYGVVLDGVTASTTAYQELFDANTDTRLSKGETVIDATVTIRPLTLIQGAGQDLEDQALTNPTGTRINGTGTGAIIDNLVSPLTDAFAGKIKLRDFTIVGKVTSGATNSYCLYFQASQRVDIVNVSAAWATSAAIYIASSVVNSLTNCLARYSEDVGLHLARNLNGAGSSSFNALKTTVIGGTYSQNANVNILIGIAAVNVNLRGVDIESAGSFYPSGDGFGVYIIGEANTVSVNSGSWFENNKIHMVIGENVASPSVNTIPRNINITETEFWSYRGDATIKINAGKVISITNNRFFDPTSKIILWHYCDNPVIRDNFGPLLVEDGNSNTVIVDNKSTVNNFPYSAIINWPTQTNCTVTQSFEPSPAGLVPVYKITPTAPGEVSLKSNQAPYAWLHNRQSISCYVKTDAPDPIDFYVSVASVNVPRVYTGPTNDITSIGSDWKIHKIGRSVDSADTGNQAHDIIFTAVTTDPVYVTGFVSIDGLVYDDYVLPEGQAGDLTNSATPSVYGLRHAYTVTGTATPTDLLDGALDQVVTIHFKHVKTITDGTNIFLQGSVNFVGAVSDTLTLHKDPDGNWYEISRSVN